MLRAIEKQVVAMGILWSLLASALFSVMSLCVKMAGHWFGAGELVFYRSLIGFVTMSLVLGRLGLAGFQTPHWRWHLSRGVTGSLALLCFFLALVKLPLGTAVSLNYTSPLFLALYLVVQHRQPMARSLLLALGLGFAGVVLMLKPVLAGQSLLYLMLGACSGVLAGFAYLAVRELGHRQEPATRTVWYFTLVSLLVAVGLACWQGWHWPEEWRAWGWVLLMGGSATLAQYALTHAYRYGPTLVIGCMAYVTVLLSTVWEHLLWPHPYDISSLVGEGLVILSGVLAIIVRRA